MDLLDRLYARLARELGREPGGSGVARITVGDVYQRLVPYRAVRGDMGIMELAQYEDALLRLLAGERGYLRVEDDEARLELQRELASSNPILGVYRDYAAAPLTLLGADGGTTPAPTREGTYDATEEAPRPGLPPMDYTAEAYPVAAQRPTTRPEARPAREATPPAPPSPQSRVPAQQEQSEPPSVPEPPSGPSAPESTASAGRESGPCRRCGEALPREEDLRFCPACGENQREVPCDRCGGPLKEEWKFCIRCGTPRPGVAPRR